MAIDIKSLSATDILALEQQIAEAKEQTKLQLIEELAAQLVNAHKTYGLTVATVSKRAREIIDSAKPKRTKKK